MPRKITDQQLLEFAAGQLAGEDARAVADHLEKNSVDANTVRLYRLAADATRTDDSEAPPTAAAARAKAIFNRPRNSAWLEAIERIVAAVVFDSRLQTAAVRDLGTADRFELTFEGEDCTVDLQAERLADDDRRERWRLRGQIGGSVRQPGIELRVHPVGSDDPVATTHTDENAYFDVTVETGEYDLCLVLPNAVFVMPDIDVR